METQTSTETGVVSVDYCIPVVLWARYWLDAKGYDVFDDIFFQNNKGVIILENNG